MCFFFAFTPLVHAEVPNWIELFKQATTQEEQGNNNTARKLYEQGAEQSDYPTKAYFQSRLGIMQWEGRGFPKNIQTGHDLMVTAYTHGAKSPELFYYLGEKAEQDRYYETAAIFKAKAALGGDPRGLRDLPVTLTKLLHHKNPYADHNPKAPKPWDAHMPSIAAPYLDYKSPSTFHVQWAVAFEHGIGVPKNPVAAQAIYLAMAKSMAQFDERTLQENNINPEINWTVENLSPQQEEEAYRLFTRIWEIAKDKSSAQDRYSDSKLVFDTLLKYAQKHQ